MTTSASQQAATVLSPYVPRTGRIVEMQDFTAKERWYRLHFEDGQGISYKAGQFMEVSVFGVGEAPISICSSPTAGTALEMCIRNVGDVTNAVHRLGVGDAVGLRGPFGNGFDLSSIEGMDVLFVAGGLGLAPCRGFIERVLDNRGKYGDVTILYGGRSPADLLFKDDLKIWDARTDCNFMVTVDRPDESWKGNRGVITTLFRKIKIDPKNTAVFIIGPPIMFKFAVLEVLALRVPETRIVCSLERRMKCGLGKCGHCQIRDVYVCQSGPIFTYAEVKKLREGI
jgi:sulfite reductase subunit B